MLYQNIPQPGIQQPTAPDTSHSRRGAYAAMHALEERFFEAGICTEQVWEFIKSENAVDSRAKLSAPQWARIAAQLQSVRRDTAMFKIFVDGIPDSYFRIHVSASDPSVGIGRPHIDKQHIAEEWGCFQEIANLHQCEITVKQGKRTTYYLPNPVPKTDDVPPASDTEDDRHSVPIANARGEVLSPWGDVMEVRTC